MIPNSCYNFCFFLAFIFLVNANAKAQEQKTGYINTDVILNEIPEYKGIQQQLRVLGEQWRAEIGKMQQQIDQLEEDFKSKEILYTDEVRRQKKSEIEQLEQSRRQYIEQKFGPEGEYFQRQAELLKPIQQNIYEAVIAVAERRGFDFIFDRAKNSSLLFGRKQWNLNTDVLQELGISLNE